MFSAFSNVRLSLLGMPSHVAVMSLVVCAACRGQLESQALNSELSMGSESSTFSEQNSQTRGPSGADALSERPAPQKDVAPAEADAVFTTDGVAVDPGDVLVRPLEASGDSLASVGMPPPTASLSPENEAAVIDVPAASASVQEPSAPAETVSTAGQMTAPQVTAPQVTAPQVTTPQVTTPQVTTPPISSAQVTTISAEITPGTLWTNGCQGPDGVPLTMCYGTYAVVMEGTTSRFFLKQNHSPSNDGPIIIWGPFQK